MFSGSESAPTLLGNVAEGSRRDDASPLSLPGPFTDSDSEPYRFKPEHEWWWGGRKTCDRMDAVSSKAAIHSQTCKAMMTLALTALYDYLT